MASICQDPGGRRRIVFISPDGYRRTLRLGTVSHKRAETVRGHVEELVRAADTGHAMANATAEWLARLSEATTRRLAAVHLIPDRESVALKTFLDEYIESRSDVKPNTFATYDRVRLNLIEHFGAGRGLRTITEGCADGFEVFLCGLKLAESTRRKRLAITKQFFRAAVRRKLIPRNPFEELKTTHVPNPSRMFFVTREVADKVLDACPDAQWRLMVALARYGGVRTPSETLALTWADVDWERNRIRVPSPKTERHTGHASRMIPLFPELLPHLREVFEQAEPGTEHVITRYRDTRGNLRTQLCRIIRAAGLEPWEKPWQNMRSTRETELADEHPIHVVCNWIGNTEAVARKHYLQVTDEHFDRATMALPGGTEKVARNPARNQAQQTPAGGRNASRHELSTEAKSSTGENLRNTAENREKGKRARVDSNHQPPGSKPVTLSN